jgi:hypothetical protein
MYFLEVKQGYSAEKWKKINGYSIFISAGMKFRNKKEFWYDILAYTSPF